ncbi:RGS domain-containing protein [Acephala macrosclerotiorum]|nr:RGS domain-containing protein [Acephala macrosclerotiorum]
MATRDSPTLGLNRNRLPTLFEVLSRQTLAPVDLYFFYLYMRDQQRAVDYLDFWLDVAQHMSLCRHYVRELRRSVMVGTPDGDKTGSKRSSALLENLGNLDQAGPSINEKDKNQDAQMSAFLREDAGNGTGVGVSVGADHSPSASTGSNIPRPSFMSSPQNQTDSSSPQHTISRADIRASAEKILYTYLLPMSEREIGLPDDIRNPVIEAIETRGRDDPEVFDAAKDWVFQAMERDAFPGFLRSKALGNLVPPSMMFRLILGLVAMFGGYWAAFVLIFLDSARHLRLYLIIPFTLGVFGIVCWYWSTDAFLALAGYSEHGFFKFSKIHEPFVGKLLKKRACMALVVFIVVATAVNCLFIFVPGYHL